MLVNKDLSCVYENLLTRSQTQSPLDGAKDLYVFPTASLSSVQFVEYLCFTWASGRLNCFSFSPSQASLSFLPCKGRFLQSLIERDFNFYWYDWAIYTYHLANISCVSKCNSWHSILPKSPNDISGKELERRVKEGKKFLPTLSASSSAR